MSQNTSSRISLANIVAVVGLTLLSVCIFVGHSYKSRAEWGQDLAWAVGLTAVAGALLWFLIRAKGAENELRRWRIVEWLTLGVYVVALVPATYCSGIMQFVAVQTQKEHYQQIANEDVAGVDAMYRSYIEQSTEAIDRTVQGLKNLSMNSRYDCDNKVRDFLSENQVRLTSESISNYRTLKTDQLMGPGVRAWKQEADRRLNDIRAVYNAWSLLYISSSTKQLHELSDEMGEKLSQLSATANLPVIDRDENSYRVVDSPVAPRTSYRVYRFTIKQDSQACTYSFSPQLPLKLPTAGRFSLPALLALALIHLLILFNYFVAYRTTTISARDNKYRQEDGGISLS